MKKLIRHIKRWNKWRKRCGNSTWHKILVLFGIRKSPTLPLVRTDDEESIDEAFWRGFRDGISGRRWE